MLLASSLCWFPWSQESCQSSMRFAVLSYPGFPEKLMWQHFIRDWTAILGNGRRKKGSEVGRREQVQWGAFRKCAWLLYLRTSCVGAGTENNLSTSNFLAPIFIDQSHSRGCSSPSLPSSVPRLLHVACYWAMSSLVAITSISISWMVIRLPPQSWKYLTLILVL